MASSPDGNSVILVGGTFTTGTMDGSQTILELKADNQGWVGSWTSLTAKLQYSRFKHIVIPVLMDKEICGLDGIVPTTPSK